MTGSSGPLPGAAPPRRGPVRRLLPRSSRRLGLRGRLLVVAAGLLAASLAAASVAQARLLVEEERRQTREAVARETREFAQLARGRDPATGRPWGSDVEGMFDAYFRRNVQEDEEVVITVAGGSVYRTSGRMTPVALAQRDLLERWAGEVGPAQGRAETSGGGMQWAAYPVLDGSRPLGAFVVAEFTADAEARVRAVIVRSALASLVVLVLAVIAARAAMGRGLRPLQAVAETAREIGETDLSRRIPVRGDDEVAEVGVTFNAMLDRLERAFTAQRHLISDAGHELRAPVTVIRGHLDVMGRDPAEVAATVRLVRDELDRMGRMVDDLLVLASVEQPDFVRREPVDVERLVEEAFVKASALGPRAWRLRATATGRAHLDRHRVQQALVQLAQNAVQYSAPDSEVEIGSAERGDELLLWVRDHGIGVRPEEREAIFDRFVRGRGARQRFEGAGLGLSIVQGIVAAHGGTVRVEAPEGGGTRFVVSLPRGPAQGGPLRDPTGRAG